MEAKIQEAKLSVVPLFDLPDIPQEHRHGEKKWPLLQPDFKLDDQLLCLPVHAEDAEDLFEICEEKTEAGPAFTLDENLELHTALLKRTCEEFHEALDTRDYPLMQDIWSWFLDKSWRPFSFRVCAALAEVDVEIFLFQLSMQLTKHWPNLLIQKPDCSPTTNCLPGHNQ